MKKIISMVFIAGMILNGASYVSAEEAEAPKGQVPVQNDASKVQNEAANSKDTDAAAPSVLCKCFAPVKKFVVDYKKPLAVVGVLVAGYAGHKVMVSVCPWYKCLVGADEEEETKTPKLNPRVMNPKRPF